MFFGGVGFVPDAAGTATAAYSPFIGAQAGADDLWIAPGGAAYPAANATVYRVYEYAVPVTTVATVPSAYPTVAGVPGIAAYPAPFGGGFGGFGGFGAGFGAGVGVI